MHTTDLRRHLTVYLNALLALDQEAIRKLMETRVACNDELRDHPTVLVEWPEGEAARVGLLGVLNGFLLSQDAGIITAHFTDDQSKLLRFSGE